MDLQRKVKQLQLPVFNPSSGRGDSAGKQAVELLRGDEDKDNEDLAPHMEQPPLFWVNPFQ